MIAATLLGAAMALAIALPLAWKWELGVGRAALTVLALCAASGAALAALGSDSPGAVPAALAVCALSLCLAAAIVLYRFYRDPERSPPGESDVIVSPADGRVIYVRASADGKLPVSRKNGREYTLEELTKTPLAAGEAVVVGIALNFLDVHVNRSPIAGTVMFQQHHRGAFRSLKHTESLFENERATTVIESEGRQVAVVLIASRLVRRIVSYIRAGDHVAVGQRIGAIRFGSQVDLVLPAEWATQLCVGVGDRVSAGESVVAVLPGAAGGRRTSELEGPVTSGASVGGRVHDRDF